MPSKRSNDLSPRQEKAIVALLNEPTMQRAAEVAGVTDRTLTRWMRDPVFRLAFRRARRDSFKHAMSMAQKYAPVALNTLAVISSDRGAPPGARVSASKAVLDFGRESLELDDLLEEVEQQELFGAPAQSGDVGPPTGGDDAGANGGADPAAATVANVAQRGGNGTEGGGIDGVGGEESVKVGSPRPERRKFRLGVLQVPVAPRPRRRGGRARRVINVEPSEALFPDLAPHPPADRPD